MIVEQAGYAFGTVWDDATMVLEGGASISDIEATANEIRTVVKRREPTWREIGTSVRPWGARIRVTVQYAHDV